MSELEAQLRAYGSVLDRADAIVADVIEIGTRAKHRTLMVAVAAALVVIVASTFAVVATRSGGAKGPRLVAPGSTLPTSTPTSVPKAAGGVLAIGDSVMLGAKDALEAEIPGIQVDAAISRQFHDAIGILTHDESAGAPPVTVVVALGTNGSVTAQEVDAFMRAAGELEVYFVTVRVPRPWESEVNATLLAAPPRWPNAHVIDWHEFAGAHDDWFVLDGFHLTTAGQHAYASLIASSIGRLPVPAPPEASGLDVVAAIAEPVLAPQPLAVAGGDVWIASEAHGDRPSVHLEGRDPTTAKVLRTIDVPQEAVFGIAGDGNTLWVAGGGDGGVPDTTVSKVDLTSNSVVFSKTLTGTPCSCRIVAGSAGVWLLGNSSDYALHLSDTDGHVLARVPLPASALGAIETRGRVVVGLVDGSVVLLDPQTNRIAGNVATDGGPDNLGAVTAMGPAAVPAIGSDPPIDGFIVKAGGVPSGDGAAFALLDNGRWQANDLLAPTFVATAVVGVRDLMWALGGDQLEVASTHAVVSNNFTYDPDKHVFVRAVEGASASPQGFRDAVSVHDVLWVVYDSGASSGTGSVEQSTVVVVKAPENFPFK